MASEKIDALELDITSKLDTGNLDKVIAKLDELSKALDKLKGKNVSVNIKQTGDAAKAASSGVDKLSSSFLNQAIRITAVVAAFKKMYSVISDGIANSANYIKTLNMFTLSLGENADSATKYGETVQDALGIDIADWQNTQGVFQTLVKGMNITGERAAYMSQNLTQLAYDISSYYGITLSEAANKLKSAMAGRVQPVRQIGYNIGQSQAVDYAKNPANYGKQTFSINEQTGAIEANTVAIDKNTQHRIVNYNQLTADKKGIINYNLLMSQNTQVQGAFAKALNDPYNQLKIFKDQLNITSRSLGNMFIPVLNKVLPYLSAFAQLAAEAFQSLAKLFGFEIPNMKERAKIDPKPYDDVVKATGKAAKNTKQMKDYLLGIDELNVFNPNTGAGAGSGIGGGKNSNLDNMKLKGYDFLGKAIENNIKEAKEKLQKFFDAIKKNPYEIYTILHIGGGELGSKIWEKILGKTPEQLAAEARMHGKTINQEFFDQFVGKVGEQGSDIWTLILGKTPAELAQDAQDNGRTEADQFIYGLLEKFHDERTWLVGTIFDSKHIAERAREAGRTFGEEFGIELTRAYLKAQKGNPLFEATTRLITGKSVDELLAGVDKQIPGKEKKKRQESSKGYVSADEAKRLSEMQGVRKQNELEARYNLKLNVTGNTSADEAKKAGAKYVKDYASGMDSEKATVNSSAKEVYKSGYNGITNDGTASSQYAYVSADQAKAYYTNLATKASTGKVEGAADKLGKAGINELKAFNNGKVSFSYPTTGDNAGKGYILGVNKHKDEAKKVGGIIGLNSLNQIRKTLGIKSPSREFMKVGDFSVEGFAKGIEESSYLASNATKNMATSALSALGNASDLSNKIIMNGSIADPMSSARVNVPAYSMAGYGIGAANEGAMASLASSVYQAVVSGMTAVNANAEKSDIKVVIDGKEVFKAVQTEQRKRGAVISNGAFSR